MCRGQKSTGTRLPRWSHTTASSRPAASPRCSIRCGSGARTASRRWTARPRPWPPQSRRRGTAICLRADHFLHLRCEVPMPTSWTEASELFGRPDVRLASLMDHTPGQRQFRDEDKLRDYYRGKKGGMTDAELDMLFAQRLQIPGCLRGRDNYRQLVELARTPLNAAGESRRHHAGARRAGDLRRGGYRGVSDHDRSGASAARGRHSSPHGRAESRAGRLACRECRDRRAGARRRASTSCRRTMCRRAC